MQCGCDGCCRPAVAMSLNVRVAAVVGEGPSRVVANESAVE